MRAFALMTLGCLLAGSLSACAKDDKKPATQPAATTLAAKPADKPIPGLKETGMVEEKPGETEVLVKQAYDRKDKEAYAFDRDFPVGVIRGTCMFKAPAPTTLPAAAGPELRADSIKDVRAKELDYYKNLEVKLDPWWVQHGAGKNAWYQPVNCVIMLKGVTKGRRPPMERPVMMIRQGAIRPGDDTNFGANNVQFCPRHERAQFTTWDSYPSHIKLTRQAGGQVAFEGDVKYAQESKDNSTGFLEYKPELITTEPLRQAGLYVVQDARHPWIVGYLFVVDHPFVAVTRRENYDKKSNFEIAAVPPGKWTMEVWHPTLKPVQREIEIEVKKDTATEVVVEFYPPEQPASATAPTSALTSAPTSAPAR